MSKTINLDFHFKKDNAETTRFSDSFFQDLRECLIRFRLEVSLNDKKSGASDSFSFIFLSSNDLEDKKFLNEIVPLADSQNTFLLSLDPIKTTDKSFLLHKFRIFNFWNEIKETGELRYFRRTAGSNNAQYWERITDIAIVIDERDGRSNGSKRGKVYLAQTDNAQSADRDNLVRDLNEKGFEVVPERMLSMDFNECSDQIKQLLIDCRLVIHPIPLVYSRYFIDKQISIVEHQAVLSAQYAADKQFDVKRIIWIPSDFDISDEDNQIFVEKIQRDQDQKNNTMVLKVTLEELKKIYSKILSGEFDLTTEEKMPDIYLVGDNVEELSGNKILKSDGNEGMTINTNFKGITYNQHLKYLANSEFVIINYTSENEPWFMMKVNDIFKSKGIRASKPFKKLILVKESKDLDTSAFESRFSEVHVSSLKDLKLDLAVKNN